MKVLEWVGHLNAHLGISMGIRLIVMVSELKKEDRKTLDYYSTPPDSEGNLNGCGFVRNYSSSYICIS